MLQGAVMQGFEVKAVQYVRIIQSMQEGKQPLTLKDV